ncbi:hypothetical protein AWZ03_011931 [Drosophila navojoa]|uniref:N-acetylgalactosaminide beta-1,3-galactosyltransferase n=1 Tax=Drosophila navojoa TaxID=7232 RepID=A0A484B1D6_DRONA|nr:hypothetical protein AWZ03_011931 [Drosophila navojoa]
MYKNVVKQQEQRLHLLLMLLLGLIFGSCISRLLQLARHEFYSNGSASTDASSNGQTADTLYRWRMPSDHNGSQRILCMVTVRPVDKERRVHIESTWGKRCHKLLILNGMHKNLNESSPLMDENQQTYKSSISSSSNTRWSSTRSSSSISWGRTREYLHHVYTHYHGQYDWFLMVTDETYVIMENLQHFLMDYSPELPIYFDSFTYAYKENHTRGGSGGNLFSREALHRFVTLGHGNSTICSSHNYGIKHVEIARCFRNVGVAVGKSSDEHGLPLLHSAAAQSRP